MHELGGILADCLVEVDVLLVLRFHQGDSIVIMYVYIMWSLSREGSVGS